MFNVKKKKPKYILMLFKNFKNTLANTTYQELISSGLWAKSGLTSLHEIKFYWNRVTSIHLHFVYGKRWQGTTDNFWPRKPKILTIEPLNKSLLTLALHDCRDVVKGNNLQGQDATSGERTVDPGAGNRTKHLMFDLTLSIQEKCRNLWYLFYLIGWQWKVFPYFTKISCFWKIIFQII